MAEEKILNIKKLKVICKQCKTEVITNLGRDINNCPCCYTSFKDQSDDSIYQKLFYTLNSLSRNQNAEFSLICEREENE